MQSTVEAKRKIEDEIEDEHEHEDEDEQPRGGGAQDSGLDYMCEGADPQCARPGLCSLVASLLVWGRALAPVQVQFSRRNPEKGLEMPDPYEYSAFAKNGTTHRKGHFK